MINQNIAQGKWKQVKGSIQKTWGKLTSDELDKAEGDMTKVAGMIQERYGMQQEEARNKLNELVSQFGKEDADDTAPRH